MRTGAWQRKMWQILRIVTIVIGTTAFNAIFLTRLFPQDSSLSTNIAFYTDNKNSLNKSQEIANNSVTNQSISEIPYSSPNICPSWSPLLMGHLNISQEVHSMDFIESLVGEGVSLGGQYSPPNCVARHKVAIVIPYRNRPSHLPIFLHHMHPILKRQQLDYRIFVVNQLDSNDFNHAMLCNVGLVEAMKDANWDCFVFHDLDLLPEDDRNLYTCPENPRHMAVAVNTFNYKLAYPKMFGGVVALRKAHLLMVNGFTNQFWGWGGEDDEMSDRIANKKLRLARYNETIARYTMTLHPKEKPNERRYENLKKAKRHFDSDGLNNLKYKLFSKEAYPLYTNISVFLEPVQPLSRP